jgi:tRNA U34 5-methylaminomethyl-2-thiouridine-forming methyltransferase MnmC
MVASSVATSQNLYKKKKTLLGTQFQVWFLKSFDSNFNPKHSPCLVFTNQNWNQHFQPPNQVLTQLQFQNLDPNHV